MCINLADVWCRLAEFGEYRGAEWEESYNLSNCIQTFARA